MLVAYGPTGQSVVAEETPLEQLQQWSRARTLYCPNCRGVVHVRGGAQKRTQLHFAHQKGECAWSTESESVRHARGKVVLAQWLQAQFPQATITLEERLPEPSRIADVFVRHQDGQIWAIEFQCAPLDLEEWRQRHQAYRKAGIIDTWIIGTNRRQKQEAFIEAILTTAHEILFLDPQVMPPRTWLRWPITRQLAQEWLDNNIHQTSDLDTPSLDGWVGRMGYGATLMSSLYDIRLDEQANLIHPVRASMEARTRLIQTMGKAAIPDASQLTDYLYRQVGEEALHLVLIPLLKAYLLDPELLKRYNYGRGQANQAPAASDSSRIHKARAWLAGLAQQGYTADQLHALAAKIPFVGPYAAFATYIETLITLAESHASRST